MQAEEAVGEASRLWGPDFDASSYAELEKAKKAVTFSFPSCEQQTVLALSCLHQYSREDDKGLRACRAHNAHLVQCMLATYCPKQVEGFVDCVQRVAPEMVADVSHAPRACQAAFDELDECMSGHTM